jgi:MFS family permease
MDDETATEESIAVNENLMMIEDESELATTPVDEEDTMPTSSTTHTYKYKFFSHKFFGLDVYQYIVLLSCWIGWFFDAFDLQLFVFAGPFCIPYLLGYEDTSSPLVQQKVALWQSILTSLLLLGWGFGGIVFGALSDIAGRARMMLLAILMYSIGTTSCAFAFHIAFLIVFRFISALGIGGEFSSGAALVSETFPKEKRVIGGVLLYAAAPVGVLCSFFLCYALTTSSNHIPVWLGWRLVFASAIVPAILSILIRMMISEPKKWRPSDKVPLKTLFANHRRDTIATVILCFIIQTTIWIIQAFIPLMTSYLALQYCTRNNQTSPQELKKMKDTYAIIGNVCYNIGAVIGNLFCYPIAERFGRVWLCRIYFIGGFVTPLIAFLPPMPEFIRLLLLFPVGFFVFGIFAAFTFYLPELFPMEVRGTGIGFSYNVGRLLSAAFPFIAGVIISKGFNPLLVLSTCAVAPLIGILFTFTGLLRETKGIEFN